MITCWPRRRRASVAVVNAKDQRRIGELQDFVARFSANKSKARQATSAWKQVDKLKGDGRVKPSSRQNPYIRFEMEDKDKLHRQAVDISGVSKSSTNR